MAMNNDDITDYYSAQDDGWGAYLPSEPAEIEADRQWRRAQKPVNGDYTSGPEDAF